MVHEDEQNKWGCWTRCRNDFWMTINVNKIKKTFLFFTDYALDFFSSKILFLSLEYKLRYMLLWQLIFTDSNIQCYPAHAFHVCHAFLRLWMGAGDRGNMSGGGGRSTMSRCWVMFLAKIGTQLVALQLNFFQLADFVPFPNKLVSWCFQPSQPQRITSGLKTNFTLFPSYLFHR